MNSFDSSIHAFLSHTNWPIEPLLQLILAAIAGGLIGFEREVRGRQAGLRTNILVCVGCAMAMLVSINLAYHDFPARQDVRIQVDPGRIAYGVMAGIGFLGGGVIVRHHLSVHGLTTAAALWCVAAIGLAAGMGLYALVLFGVIIVLSVLWLLSRVERRLPRAFLRTVTLRRAWDPGCIVETRGWLEKNGIRLNDISFERNEDLRKVDIHAVVAVHDLDVLYNLQKSADAGGADRSAYEVIRVRE